VGTATQEMTKVWLCNKGSTTTGARIEVSRARFLYAVHTWYDASRRTVYMS
jgi:hypothetical protein